MKITTRKIGLCSLSLLLTIIACNKNDSDPKPVPPKVLKITTTSLKAKGGQTIELNGEGFSEVLTQNAVTINDQALTVTQATATSLKATVPAKVGDGKVIVKVGTQTVEGPSFTYDWVWNVSTPVLTGQVPINMPGDLTVDADGNIYVVEQLRNRIKKITPDGSVSIFAGAADGSSGLVNGQGTGARFNMPAGLRIGQGGELIVADGGNQTLRGINTIGVVRTIPTPASSPGSLVIKGNTMFIGDFVNNRLFSWDGNTENTLINGGITPIGLGMDAAGFIYIANSDKNQILRVGADKKMMIWAGSKTGQGGTMDGIGEDALFYNPRTAVVDAKGYVFVADFWGHNIRMIDPNRAVFTIAGKSTSGGNDGPGRDATFDGPNGIAIDGNGDLYISDWGSNRIRKLSRQ